MDVSKSRRRRSFVNLMKQLQTMSENEVELVAQISGKVFRARRAIREAAEAADAYLHEQDQRMLALSAPGDIAEAVQKPPESVN